MEAGGRSRRRYVISLSSASSPMPPLKEKRAYVCGSTQGIGKACAERLARDGASVTLIARNEDALTLVCDSLDRSAGQTHDWFAADFSDWRSVQQQATRHAHENGPIHILINNTGGPTAGRAAEANPEDFLRAFEMHLLCNQVLLQAVISGMAEAKYGRIVNIISTSVVTPIRGLGVSNTIRGAVANWGRTIADELGEFGITCNNVLPGFTDTTRLASLFRGRAEREGTTLEDVRARSEAGIPARRLGTPEEIAATVAFLCSPDGAYVNGVNLPIDGGRLAAQ